MANKGLKVLYIDDTCKITDACIVLKKYYFPLPTSRNILFDQIEKVTLGSAVHFNQKWGLSVHDMNNWFPYDSKRRNKNFFIALHLKGKKIIPSFTPLDSAKVFTILKEHAGAHHLTHIVFEDATCEQGKVIQQIQVIEEASQQSYMSKDLLKGSTDENFFINA